jgi:transposase
MGIKLSEIVSDLLGVSGQRILRGIASGESNPEVLAAMADRHLRATKGELCEAFEVVKKLDPRYLVVLQQFLDRLELNEKHSEELKAELAKSLKPHEAAVERVAEIPGMGPDSAQQVIAEVGPKAERFESAAALCSWTGVTPGENVSAGKSHGDRCPKGNMALRRVLNQAANATVKAKGTVFEAHYKRIVGRDPRKHFTAIGAVVHKLEAVIWKVLHDGVRYEERGKRQNPEADRRRAVRLTRELKRLGYDVVPKAVSTPVGG